jgi:serine/threonine protein phosphatase PrpC
MELLEMEERTANVSSWIEWGVAARAALGHDESGDQYVVKVFDEGILVGLVDGLGHGSRAMVVAKTAVETLAAYAHEPVDVLLKRCHGELRGTRGVVMSLASFKPRGQTLSWLSVGNVRGWLFNTRTPGFEGPGGIVKRKSLMLRGGIVGYQLPNLYPSHVSVEMGDVLIFATDGISSDFADDVILANGLRGSAAPQQIADDIFAQYAQDGDDATVLVVRYRGAIVRRTR